MFAMIINFLNKGSTVTLSTNIPRATMMISENMILVMM